MPSISDIITASRPDLSPCEALYKSLHANPELSLLEHETHDTIHTFFRDHLPSFTLKPAIAHTGLVAILSNGDGPTIMLRADTDALPVREQTSLPYASTKTMKDKEGNEQPVMHACGHDMHISSMLAVAETMVKCRDHWSGTLELIFQPAEEKAAGARAMLSDGLYDPQRHAVPVPDLVIGAHVMPMPSGHLGARAGVMASYADSWRITLHGKGGHASQPHRTVDPVLLASSIVMRLQGIVSREVDPQEPAVVTVASVRAGEAENVIPERAEVKVNVRTFSALSRDRVLGSIKRIVKAECDASGCEKEVEYEVISSFPILNNDPTATEKLAQGMKTHFGAEKWHDDTRLGGSEDFGLLATEVGKPSVYFAYGGVDPKEWEAKKGEVPVNHSAFFAPVVQPTLRTAVEGLAVAALTWLGEGEAVRT